MREVNKIAGEPMVNIRKIKQVRTIKTTNSKTLNVKLSRLPMVDEIVDDA